MTKEAILQCLQTHRDELKALGIRSLKLFGSVARGESTETSDIDLLVDFDRPIGLFDFARAQIRLSLMLNCKVDLVLQDALLEEFKGDILREAIDAA